MPPEFGSPKHWLLYAKSDLAMANIERHPDILIGTLCFHVQQCVVKSLKAILLFRGIKFPQTHNIGILVELVKKSGLQFPDDFESVITLTHHVAEGRYPHDLEPMTLEQYNEELALAKNVYKWAVNIISGDKDKNK